MLRPLIDSVRFETIERKNTFETKKLRDLAYLLKPIEQPPAAAMTTDRPVQFSSVPH